MPWTPSTTTWSARSTVGSPDFVSITPPGFGLYSLDKYVERSELPFVFDDGLFEVRILTVDRAYRGTPLAALLMHAALRWVEDHGGTRIVIIGRAEVAGLYERVGMVRLGRQVHSGAVTYELMTATVEEIHERTARFARLQRRLGSHVVWSLTIPFERPLGAFHGGASHHALGPDPSAAKRAAIIAADVLDAWFPPAPEVLATLQDDVAWMAATSPPADAVVLRAAIARQLGVDDLSIAAGAGLSDLIFRSLPLWLAADSSVLVVEPQYGEYRHVLEHLVACRVDSLKVDSSGMPTDVLMASVRSGAYDMVVLVDPNNPMGYRLDPATLRELISAVAPATRLWIDRTYAPFDGPDFSAERLAGASRNVVVGMSMSKAYALSGLRLGYLRGPTSMMEEVRSVTPPWAVSRPAQAAGLAAIAAPAYYADRYRETALLREELTEGLAAIDGICPRAGAANFVFCKLDPPLDAATIIERSRALGLYLRSFPTDAQLRWHAIRVAVKDRSTQERMLEILMTVVEETRRARSRAAPTFEAASTSSRR